MKIDPSGVSPIVPRKREAKLPTDNSTPHSSSSSTQSAGTKPTDTSSTGSTQQKISRWFTQVGLSPNADYVDYKAKSVAARRHEDIRRVKRTENLQKIMNIACHVSVPENTSDNTDADWFYAFIDLAENIYTPAMQEVWGKILAVEISRPGSFSLRSLETLKQLTQRDAQLFSAACKLASVKSSDPVPRLITHFNQRKSLFDFFIGNTNRPINLANYGLSYPALLSLIELGLLMPSEIESAEVPLKQSIAIRCGETAFEVSPKKTGLALVYYKFSNVGAELFLLSKKKENTEYVGMLKRTLSLGFTLK
jgi:uncharacterized repeat protein (TIGR03899 family)